MMMDWYDKTNSEGKIMCNFLLCKEIAEVKVPRASTNLCSEHLDRNTLIFGCKFTTEPVNRFSENGN